MSKGQSIMLGGMPFPLQLDQAALSIIVPASRRLHTAAHRGGDPNEMVSDLVAVLAAATGQPPESLSPHRVSADEYLQLLEAVAEYQQSLSLGRNVVNEGSINVRS
jgi:hypothetical protein